MSGPLRLTVLGGFLGAGKSTWLRHHLGSGIFDGACVVVNEAAATSLDDLLLAGAGQLRVLSGGCACCERRDDLLALLRDLRGGLPPDGGRAFDHVVLETSGLADPRAIVAAVGEDPTLARAIVPGEIVVLVDAVHGFETLAREPLAQRQVAGADCLIVTKLDEADEAAAARLVAGLGLLNPSAPRFGAVRGVETRTAARNRRPRRCPARRTGGRDRSPDLHRRKSRSRVSTGPASRCGCPPCSARAGRRSCAPKASIGTPAGRLLLQVVQGRVHEPVVLPGPPAASDGRLVVIGRGFVSGDLQGSMERWMATCGASPFTR